MFILKAEKVIMINPVVEVVEVPGFTDVLVKATANGITHNIGTFDNLKGATDFLNKIYQDMGYQDDGVVYTDVESL